MQPITYRVDRKAERRTAILWAVMSLLSLLFLSAAVAGVVEDDTWIRNWSLVSLFIAILAISAVNAVHHFRGEDAKRYRLQLDDEGLTYTREGRERRWPWRALSRFKCARHSALIVFIPPDEDEFRATGLMITLMLGHPSPIETIKNIYDAPLDEIAAALNEHRDRAPGGGEPT
ncbi:MAG: hypothetical protein OEU09_18055 [Rhodospirillales bacterium]|nr:hypothetical protein [Rhodospirillales bacterium]MDH3790562.1 hypothetical protein [Rhodospirillales bacterium]MDH3913193.1 hypothetical protein [Rhodospirillales bacterium]MDH3919138.1 hypothetical protein [Rhodospirillales bacterium]MDH3967620.1 hypothetical protein [Rhodospirillales bacterium]